MKETFHTSHLRSILLDEFKRFVFKKLTNNAAPVFCKGGDIISIDTQLSGVHEPVITAVISSFAKRGYSDFLLDIGANIGLTACQNGDEFSEVHMFEPNPMCQHILEVNTAITLTKPIVAIHKFALGSQEKSARLMVPRHNWGGGYIDDRENTYNNETLSGKDGFNEFNTDDYLKFDIAIRDTVKELSAIFAGLANKALRKGVIKIDIEGYEPVVIRGIAQSLPAEMECYVVFESFNKYLDIDGVLSSFDGRATACKITEIKPWKRRWPKWIKALWLLFDDTISWQLEDNVSGNWKGDIALHVRTNGK